MSISYINSDTGVSPHKDGQTCLNCETNIPSTVLKPYYAKTPEGCVPFWRVVFIRADGKFECKGDLNVDFTAGYDVPDGVETCPGYLPTPDKTEPEPTKQYKTASATFEGPPPGDDPLVFTEADLAAGGTIVSISLSAAGTNDNGIVVKGGCGPADCDLINLAAGESVSWSHSEGLSGSVFEATIVGDDEGSGLRDMLEVSYVVCVEV